MATAFPFPFPSDLFGAVEELAVAVAFLLFAADLVFVLGVSASGAGVSSSSIDSSSISETARLLLLPLAAPRSARDFDGGSTPCLMKNSWARRAASSRLSSFFLALFF